MMKGMGMRRYLLSKRVPCVINGNVYAADEVSGLACLLSITEWRLT